MRFEVGLSLIIVTLLLISGMSMVNGISTIGTISSIELFYDEDLGDSTSELNPLLI